MPTLLNLVTKFVADTRDYDGKVTTATQKTTGLKNAAKGTGGQLDVLKRQVPGLGSVLSSLASPIGIATVGLGAFAGAANQSVGETVKYNKAIRESTQLTGLSAEETSRIVQVSDDWGLSIGEATSALALMNKKGVTPSIENLAKIADEYVNATNKSKFMEEATKKYGKSFGTLIPILAKGGAGLRAQTDAVNQNLIATEKSIAASRKYEVVTDDLGDALQGMKYSLGNWILPPLADFLSDALELTNKITEGINNQANATGALKRARDQGTITDKEYAIALKDLREGGEKYKVIVDNQTTAEGELQSQEDKLIGAHNSAWEATVKLSGAADGLEDSTNRAALAIIELNKAALGKEALDILNKAFIDGAIDEETYNVKASDIMRNWLNMPESSIVATLELARIKEELAKGNITALEAATLIERIEADFKRLDGTSADTVVRIHTVRTEERQFTGHAGGLRYTIPSGYTNDSFYLGNLGYAQSGEEVIIKPSGSGRGGSQATEFDYPRLGRAIRDAMLQVVG